MARNNVTKAESKKSRKESRMRTLTRGALVAALIVFSPALFGQAQLVGKDAPDFVVKDIINEAPASSLSEMAGEVILIKYWGTR